MDEELKRIEEEIRKSKEKRQELENRRIRRLRKIREKQERDRAAWLKRMTAVLDKTLCDMEGKTYFDSITQAQVADAVRRGGIIREEAEAKADPDDFVRKADKEEAGK